MPPTRTVNPAATGAAVVHLLAARHLGLLEGVEHYDSSFGIIAGIWRGVCIWRGVWICVVYWQKLFIRPLVSTTQRRSKMILRKRKCINPSFETTQYRNRTIKHYAPGIQEDMNTFIKF